MNNVVLSGRLTKKPEVSYTQSGKAVTRFTLAVDRRGKDKGADFISVVAWDKDAENAGKYLDKGRAIIVKGHIQTGSYDKGGQKVYTTDVIADEIEYGKPEPRNTEQSYHNYGGYSDPPEYRRFNDEGVPF